MVSTLAFGGLRLALKLCRLSPIVDTLLAQRPADALELVNDCTRVSRPRQRYRERYYFAIRSTHAAWHDASMALFFVRCSVALCRDAGSAQHEGHPVNPKHDHDTCSVRS